MPADVLAHRHAKARGLAQLREQARAAQLPLADAPVVLPAGPVRDWSARRVLNLITSPMRGPVRSSVTPEQGGTLWRPSRRSSAGRGGRPAARKALGLAFRDGQVVSECWCRRPFFAHQPRNRPAAPITCVVRRPNPEVSVVVLNWNRSDVTLVAFTRCGSTLQGTGTGRPGRQRVRTAIGPASRPSRGRAERSFSASIGISAGQHRGRPGQGAHWSS